RRDAPERGLVDLEAGVALQAVEVTLHLVLECLVAERRLDLLLHRLERLSLAFLPLADVDDVIPVLRLHHIARLTWLQGEGNLLEVGHHSSLAERPEVAALLRAARVGRLLLG